MLTLLLLGLGAAAIAAGNKKPAAGMPMPLLPLPPRARTLPQATTPGQPTVSTVQPVVTATEQPTFDVSTATDASAPDWATEPDPNRARRAALPDSTTPAPDLTLTQQMMQNPPGFTPPAPSLVTVQPAAPATATSPATPAMVVPATLTTPAASTVMPAVAQAFPCPPGFVSAGPAPYCPPGVSCAPWNPCIRPPDFNPQATMPGVPIKPSPGIATDMLLPARPPSIFASMFTASGQACPPGQHKINVGTRSEACAPDAATMSVTDMLRQNPPGFVAPAPPTPTPTSWFSRLALPSLIKPPVPVVTVAPPAPIFKPVFPTYTPTTIPLPPAATRPIVPVVAPKPVLPVTAPLIQRPSLLTTFRTFGSGSTIRGLNGIGACRTIEDV